MLERNRVPRYDRHVVEVRSDTTVGARELSDLNGYRSGLADVIGTHPEQETDNRTLGYPHSLIGTHIVLDGVSGQQGTKALACGRYPMRSGVLGKQVYTDPPELRSLTCREHM